MAKKVDNKPLFDGGWECEKYHGADISAPQTVKTCQTCQSPERWLTMDEAKRLDLSMCDTCVSDVVREGCPVGIGSEPSGGRPAFVSRVADAAEQQAFFG